VYKGKHLDVRETHASSLKQAGETTVSLTINNENIKIGTSSIGLFRPSTAVNNQNV
jgi:hypothetical protein